MVWPRIRRSPLNFPTLAQVLRGEGMAEAVRSDTKADPRSDPPEQFGHGHDADGFAIGPEEEGVVTRRWPPAVQIVHELSSQPAADWDPAELRPLSVPHLEKGAQAVVFEILDDQAAPAPTAASPSSGGL